MEPIRNIPAWSSQQELVSAFTTRAFGSLSTRSDPPEIIEQRYQALARNFNIESRQLLTLPQTHSNNVAIIRDRDFLDKRGGRRAFLPTDAVVSAGTVCIDPAAVDPAWQSGVDGVILMVANVFTILSTADCAPVLFWDPVNRMCGAAHVGLVGAVNQLPVRMVDLMRTEAGVLPSNLEVAILPSIRGCHYNLAKSGVWQRLKHTIMAVYGPDNPHYGNGFFDLPGFIRWQLESTGVQPAHIYDLELCTVCNAQDFFSHVQAGRSGLQDKEGRFGSIIGVRHIE